MPEHPFRPIGAASPVVEATAGAAAAAVMGVALADWPPCVRGRWPGD